MPQLWGITGGKGSQVQGGGHSKKTGFMSKDWKESQGNLSNHIHRVIEILVKTLPKSAILHSTSLMVTTGAVIPMPILTYHPPLLGQAESGNKSVKMPTNFTDDPNTKSLASTPMAKKQTAGKSGSSGTKDFPSSCIIDHQDNNGSQPSFGNFTGSLKTPVPDDHTADGEGCLLQSHKLVTEGVWCIIWTWKDNLQSCQVEVVVPHTHWVWQILWERSKWRQSEWY